ncbi:hypothetical protein ABPG72_011427 [Tetrahymena utriculariae]
MSAKKNCQLNCCMECTPTLLNLHEQNLKLQQKYQQMKLELIQANLNKQETSSSTQIFTTIKKDKNRWTRPGFNKNQMGVTQNESRSCNSTKDSSLYNQVSILNKQFAADGFCHLKSLSIEGQKDVSKIFMNEKFMIDNQNMEDQDKYNKNFQLQNDSHQYCITKSNKKIFLDQKNEFNNVSAFDFDILKQEMGQINSDSNQQECMQSNSGQKQGYHKNSSWEKFFGLKNIKKSTPPQVKQSHRSISLIQKSGKSVEDCFKNQKTMTNREEANYIQNQYVDENIDKNQLSTVINNFKFENSLHKRQLLPHGCNDFNSPQNFQSQSQMKTSQLDEQKIINKKQGQYRSQTPTVNQTNCMIDQDLSTNKQKMQHLVLLSQINYTQNSQDLSYRQPLSNNNRIKSFIEEENQSTKSPYTPQQIKQSKSFKNNEKLYNQYSQSPVALADLTNDNKLNITQRSSLHPFPIHTTPILHNLISSNKKQYYFDNSVETQTQRNFQFQELENINPNYQNVSPSPFLTKNEEKQSKINTSSNKSGMTYKNQEFRGETSSNGYAFSQKQQLSRSNQNHEFRECKQILFSKYNLQDLQQINNDSYLLQSDKNNDQTGFFNEEIFKNIGQSETRSEVISQNKLSDQQAFSVLSNCKSINSSQLSSNSSSCNTIWYKMVSRVGERYFSTFDGQTEFVIGRQITKKFQQLENGKVRGGITLHKNLQNAFNTKFPSSSTLIQYPKSILKFSTNGQRIKIKEDCYVFQQVTPIEAINLANE